MEDEVVCCGCAGLRHGGSALPIVADYAEAGGVVPQYGHDGAHWIVLCDGYLPPDTVLHHSIRHAAGVVAVSEPF